MLDFQALIRRWGPFEPLMVGLFIFALAIFLGYELITKVPPTLHTPLMSGANAISGITIVGALYCAKQDFAAAGEHPRCGRDHLRDDQRRRRLRGHAAHARDVRGEEVSHGHSCSHSRTSSRR